MTTGYDTEKFMAGNRPVDLLLTESADAAARKIVSDGLDDYNVGITGVSDNTPLDVLITDQNSGETIGGLVGRTSLGLLFINYFYIPIGLRRTGLGSRILEMAEAEARVRGCKEAVLFTISFQAPDFYERHGYSRFGEIPCDPEGTSRIFMRKTLA